MTIIQLNPTPIWLNTIGTIFVLGIWAFIFLYILSILFKLSFRKKKTVTYEVFVKGSEFTITKLENGKRVGVKEIVI